MVREKAVPRRFKASEEILSFEGEFVKRFHGQETEVAD